MTAQPTSPASSSRASSRVRIASASANARGDTTSRQAFATASGTPASARRPRGTVEDAVPRSRSIAVTAESSRPKVGARAPAEVRPQGTISTGPARNVSIGRPRSASASWRSGPRPPGRSAIPRSASSVDRVERCGDVYASVVFPDAALAAGDRE
ncbi:hypothetical protein FK85_26110, partial [Halorubrum saccharovorum]